MKTSDIARLMEMFQVCLTVSHLELHIDPSAPRVLFSSIGTSRPLMMRTYIPIRPTLNTTRPNTMGIMLDRNRSGGESSPRNEPRPPTRGKRGSTRHRRSKARAPIPQSVNPVTRGRKNAPRRRSQSFSLTKLTSCERISRFHSVIGVLIIPFRFALDPL